MLRVMLPRDQGGKFEITEGTGPIRAMISTGEHLEIYKVDKTFRVETPEKIDPKRTNPNAPFTVSTVQNVGTSNEIVARVLLQGDQILGLYAGGDRTPIRKQLHQCKESLLRCETIAKGVRSKIDAVNESVKATGIPLENSRVLKPFPHVENLEGDCSNFLVEANRAIRAISGLPSLFIQLGRTDKNFDHLGARLEAKIGATEDLTKFVKSAADDGRDIVDLRNYLEHPDKRRTVINNFHLQSDGQLSAPTWHLSDKAPVPIAKDMFEIIQGLVRVAEELVLHLVIYSGRERLLFNVQRGSSRSDRPRLSRQVQARRLFESSTETRAAKVVTLGSYTAQGGYPRDSQPNYLLWDQAVRADLRFMLIAVQNRKRHSASSSSSSSS